MALVGALPGICAQSYCPRVTSNCRASMRISSPHASYTCFRFARISSGNSCCKLCRRTRLKSSLANVTLGHRGHLCSVRAKADIERADEQAKVEAHVDWDTNGRWTGEQDHKNANALSDSAIYPIMRVYRNDICSLEITGDAKAKHVIEAMAADGGFTAAEELSKGRSLMTVETIIPGRWEEHSTVSTKLLAPTQLVSDKAKTMWSQNGVPKKVSFSSGNALAMAFQRVVMNRLLSFDIHVHRPGTLREMSNLANEIEHADVVVASVESRDPTVLEGLAEVVCRYSIANIMEAFDQKMARKKKYNKILFWGRKPESIIWAFDKAIGVSALLDHEIREHSTRILDEYRTDGEKIIHRDWWPPSVASLPSNVLPEQWNSWCTDYIPIHKLLIDTSKVNVITKGWQITKSQQVLELHLTHAQLVGLADLLDLFYEDPCTAPTKGLRSRMELEMSNHSWSKVAKALWTVALSCLAGGVLLVGLLVVARLRTSPSTSLLSNTSITMTSCPRSDSSFRKKWCSVRTDRRPLLPKNDEVPAEELEALCLQVVNRVKDAFKLAGQVDSSADKGAWMGKDLAQWGRRQKSTLGGMDSSVGDALLEQKDEATAYQVSNQEGSGLEGVSQSLATEPFLLYQVVLSRTGRVLGFQPANKPAVAHWLDFPFARELHEGHRLGAGLFEHTLKYMELSEDVVAVELLFCRADSGAISVAARPL